MQANASQKFGFLKHQAIKLYASNLYINVIYKWFIQIYFYIIIYFFIFLILI
jgi:hypothetical protein